MEKIFYVYFDEDRKALYYYDTASATTTYVKPKEAYLIDPESLQIFDFAPYRHKKHPVEESPKLVPQDSKVSFLDIPAAVAAFQPNFSEGVSRARSFMPGEGGEMPALPTDLKDDVQKFKIEDFARQFFREHRAKHGFNRKKISSGELITFSAEPIQAPLLLALSKTDTVGALAIFKHILQYTGLIATKFPLENADKIVQILSDSPILRDEAYFQLIKQTRGNNNMDSLEKTWHLFLIIATFFPFHLR